MGWQRFILSFAASFVGLLSVAAVLVFVMNPYGNLGLTLFRDHVIMDGNQRFQYPALVRSNQFDSVVMGTSDARLLNPNSLETVFGGRFANLALNAGKAWEQYRLIDLFIREVERPKLLVMALDHAWCAQNAAVGDITSRGFPEWIYDDNRLNDLLYMVNSKAVETSVRQLGYHLNLKPARFGAGYEVFTPEEVNYDLAKAKRKIWKGKSPQAIEAINPPYVPTLEERASWQFPAVAWLNEIFARFPGDVIVAFMPVHIKVQPVPGSLAAAKESKCKQRIVDIAQRYDTAVIDFRIWSDITSNDSYYWDPLHYRLPIADRIVTGIERALVTRADDPNGDWLYLTGKRAETASP